MSEPPPGAVLMTNSTGRVGCWAVTAAPPPAVVPPPGGGAGAHATKATLVAVTAATAHAAPCSHMVETSRRRTHAFAPATPSDTPIRSAHPMVRPLRPTMVAPRLGHGN